MIVDISKSLEKSRRLAAYWILVGCAVLGILIGIAGLFLPVSSVWPGMICLSAVAFGFWSFRRRHRHYCIIVGQTAMAQSIGLVAALGGTGWQIDGHMLFYAALATLVGLVHVPTIMLAAATTVLHHLSLGLVLPHLVFPSVSLLENVERALFHGAIVGIEVLVLTLIVQKRLDMTREVHAAFRDADVAFAAAEQAKQLAEAAQHRAEAEAKRAHTAQSKAEDLVRALKKEKAAREQAIAASHAADMRTAQARKSVYDAQNIVVTSLRAGLEHVARGDLSYRIDVAFPQEYEPLRRDFNRAISTLGDVLGDVMQGTSDLMELVAAVQDSAHDLARRTEAQVASLEVTSHAVDTLHGVVRASTDNAQATATVADRVRNDAVAGGDIVRRAVTAMGGIETSSREIAKINAVMDGIAFQTNLLALNAGVEAARAGEAGRGFSVVASEVRALSQRATEAARGISELTEKSNDQVQSGVALVTQAGDALQDIVQSVSAMTGSVQKIADATQAQSDQLSEVNVSVAEIDTVAQGNATMFERTNVTCASLTEGMEQMIDRLAQFKLSRRTLGTDDLPQVQTRAAG
ncbi:methyl-accepting chemotaxis protein [Tateyamaria omphalii]|uniref:methyl-accepting chemotaxis protein n=1 Tax=Tateyamaria omphalii TaxID=299262 RepID=UPI001C995044|nr:methyl-accepting chemotaxis protein [Tateyamaria omphalii]MBY5934649.1 methyl-accepting chemotaxis protein [Tateyamaria omphalii]